MKTFMKQLGRLITVSALTVGGGLVAVTHTASAAPACSDCPTLTASDDWGDTAYKPGGYTRLRFEVANPATTLARDVTLRITIPDGAWLDLDWSGTYQPDNGTFSYDAATRTANVRPTSSTDENGELNPADEWTFWLYVDFKSSLSDPSVSVTSSLTWKDRTGATRTPITGNTVSYTKAQPYILDTETSFSPETISSGGSSTMTSTITNTGTGGARAIYFYMKIDDRLTVDQTSIPAECDYYPQDTWESWDGSTIVNPQHLSCEYEGVLAPGQTVSFTVDVTAPVTAGPEEYEGFTELSCTSSAPGAYEGDFEGDSAGLLRLGPPTPGELKVVQLGGPKPIKMPTADAEPIQPTAGDMHSITTYVYNVGTNDITDAVTVVVTIPAGFTPTKITADTSDSGASAPVCTLATRTCVFSQLAGAKVGRIFIDGLLSPTITHNSKLDVSARASASSVSPATDAASFAVTSLSDVRVSLSANGAYRLGEPVAFTLGAANLGPSAAKQAVATVTIPAGASYTSVPKGCTVSNKTMKCTWSSLASGAGEVKQFSVNYGQASTALASVVLTASSPLTKDSVTTASDSRKQASWSLTRAIKSALVESQLPRTGSNSLNAALAALMLLASGAGLVTVARRRRTA